MSELVVKIVRLDPMRVASTYGFGPSPEGIAWEKMRNFMQAQGMLDAVSSHRYFGFNNPSPAPASPNYGYEQWVVVGPDVESEGDAQIKDFPGGLYAVTRCDLTNIESQWKRLVAWREDSLYKVGRHQWLEESITPERALNMGQEEFDPAAHILDLYMPIGEERRE